MSVINRLNKLSKLNKLNKTAALLFAVVFIGAIWALAAVMPVSASALTDVTEIIITGKTAVLNSKNDFTKTNGVIETKGENANFIINLTAETITIPSGYDVVMYSTDNGAKWRKIRKTPEDNTYPFNDIRFPVLLSGNKGLSLILSNAYYDKKHKFIADSGTEVIVFDEIKKRPKRPFLTTNYLIKEGECVLTEKGETNPEKANAVEYGGITLKKSNDKSVKTIELNIFPGKISDMMHYNRDNGFYQKFSASEKISSLPVGPYDDGGEKGSWYVYRFAPKMEEVVKGGVKVKIYTAASKPNRVFVLNQSQPPKYNLKEDGIINVKANSYIKIDDKETFYPVKVPVKINVNSNVEIWQAATAKKPASAKWTPK